MKMRKCLERKCIDQSDKRLYIETCGTSKLPLDGQLLMTYNELKKEAEGNTKNK